MRRHFIIYIHFAWSPEVYISLSDVQEDILAGVSSCLGQGHEPCYMVTAKVHYHTYLMMGN